MGPSTKLNPITTKNSVSILHTGKFSPQISILMPVRNCENFIVDAIESVLGQAGVVAEIIISDDASTDCTYQIALETVQRWIQQKGSVHTILMRRGEHRLRRLHFQLLNEAANCDVVFEAHGDDIQHPLRARRILDIFERDPDACLVYVDRYLINELGQCVEKKLENFSSAEIIPIPINYFFIEDTELIGAAMARKSSKLACFTTAIADLSAVGHDRIYGFRGALSGNCYFIKAPLYSRRIHANNLHQQNYHEPRESNGDFGRNLIRISFFTAMQSDLEMALEMHLVNQDQFIELNNLIILNLRKCSDWLLTAFKQLTELGYIIHWKKT